MELGEVIQDCVCACACAFLLQWGEGKCAQAVWLEGGQAAAGPVAARKAAVAIFNLDLKFPELIQMGQLRLYINANIVRKHFLPLLV